MDKMIATIQGTFRSIAVMNIKTIFCFSYSGNVHSGFKQSLYGNCRAVNWPRGGGGGGGDLVSTVPVCVCPKVKDMGPFSASSE